MAVLQVKFRTIYGFHTNLCDASLFVIQDSEYLKRIPIRYDYKKYNYKHFVVYTYDFVFHVFAVNYANTPRIHKKDSCGVFWSA